MTFRNPVERFKNEPQNTCTQLIPVTRSKCHTFFFYLRLVLVVLSDQEISQTFKRKKSCKHDAGNFGFVTSWLLG